MRSNALRIDLPMQGIEQPGFGNLEIDPALRMKLNHSSYSVTLTGGQQLICEATSQT
jgi:hypothetical protein